MERKRQVRVSSGYKYGARVRCMHGIKFKLCNGNRTEWSPIRSVIIRVITKSDDREAGVRFVYREYDYRLNWTPLSPIIN